MRYPVTILWCFGVSFSVQAAWLFTEKVDLDSGEGRLLNFLSRTFGGCCPNKKRKPVTNSFAQNARFHEQIPGKPHTFPQLKIRT